ncbi:hypothetical protein EYC80_005029 [Monilinia laxa]|uniref:Uncharacterized protein n=1 Tax=Monilinia laxa TaxID=61186 RepID=A0A5N6KIN0_MONLA|nr:hypothetical protein EYC80_005029 [Monilinia laxa]
MCCRRDRSDVRRLIVRMVPPLKYLYFCMTAGSEVIDAVKCHIQCAIYDSLMIFQHFAVSKTGAVPIMTTREYISFQSKSRGFKTNHLYLSSYVYCPTKFIAFQ